MNADKIATNHIGEGHIGEDLSFDFKKINNFLPGTFNKRSIARNFQKIERKEKSINLNNNVNYRLRMKLIKRGKEPNYNMSDLIKKYHQ